MSLHPAGDDREGDAEDGDVGLRFLRVFFAALRISLTELRITIGRRDEGHLC